MRAASPTLLPLLRSQVQGDVLALTYLSPDEEFTVTEVARRVGASLRAVQHEVARLVDAGLLVDRRQGKNRLVRAVADSPLTRPLTDLLAVTYGPLPVLRDALTTVAGVDRAFVYGSWAARYRGEHGVPPGDVDVLVVGSADADELDEAARVAERRLHREVNMRRVRPETWERPPETDTFLASVRSRPLVEVDLPHRGESA